MPNLFSFRTLASESKQYLCWPVSWFQKPSANSKELKYHAMGTTNIQRACRNGCKEQMSVNISNQLYIDRASLRHNGQGTRDGYILVFGFLITVSFFKKIFFMRRSANGMACSLAKRGSSVHMYLGRLPSFVIF